MNPVVELVGISKSFPGVAALRGVDLTLHSGRIHALVGENGAGKSTLLNVLAGVLAPDTGQIRLAGEAIRFDNPRQARRAGIVVVHQEVDLFADLCIAENVGLLTELPISAMGWIDWREQYRRTQAALEAVHERLALSTLAGELSPAQRQMLEIAAAVSQSARVLILDEPTSSLSAAEAQTLFAHLRRFREQGTAIVYVSHRFEEVFALADEVTVLRDGCRVWQGLVAETTSQDLIRHMVGREVTRTPSTESRAGERGRVRLACEGVRSADGRCADVALQVHAGEILGLYGLIGSGRSEWAQVVMGLQPGQGRIRIDDQPVVPSSPAAMANRGLAYVPEDRLRQGLCRGLSVRLNAALASLRQLAVGPLLMPWRESSLARGIMERFGVRANSIDQPIGTLSGGNQQKVVIGRWLERDPSVLILDEPTRGVDVGAKVEIHAVIRRLADDGRAVVLISSDLPEILEHSDRIGVFRQGRLVREFNHGASAEEVAAAALPTDDTVVSTHRRPRFSARLPREAGLAAIIVMLILGIEIWTRRFVDASTLGNLLSDSVLLGVVAVGAALVIIAGGIDISLGSLMALSAAVAGKMWECGLAWPLVLVIALLVGATGGAVNAALTHWGRVHPIVITLGTMSVYRGLARWWMVTDIQIPGHARNALFGEGQAAPPVVWLGLGFFALVAVALRRTLLGRRIFAVGGNASAARRVGIAPPNVWLKAFTIQGALAGLAGVLFLARSGSLQSTSYEDRTLQAISAAVVGGVAITGGRGSVLGVFLGCTLLVLLTMACQYLHISTDWQQAAVGAVLVVAVLVDARWRRRS